MPDYSTTGAVYPLKAYSITDVDIGTDEFVIAGDQTARILVGDTFSVIESTGNDGEYTVTARSYSVGNDETTIGVAEDITDATIDGRILHDEIADTAPNTESHDNPTDRDSATPDQIAGAHIRRLANEVRALGRTVGVALGFEVQEDSGIDVLYSGGMLIFGSGAPIDAPPGQLSLTDNQTNYIELSSAAVVSFNTTAFSVGKYPLAIVTTAGGAITLIQDRRGALYMAEFAEANLDNFGPSFNAATELTISGGVVTRSQGVHRIDTESDDASDDLVTINGGTNGLQLMIRAEDAARTVVLKETGNLSLAGQDITLDDTNKFVFLYYDGDLSKWVLIGEGSVDLSVYLKADGSVDVQNLVFEAATELTIAGGIVTRTQAVHTIDTESDDPTDNLDTISGGADGLIVRVRAENAARTVVLKDGTGNLELAGADITLDDMNQYVELQYDGVLSKWLVVGGAGVDLTGVLRADGSVDVINQIFNAATELTIAGGIVTRTQAVHTIDTESDDPSDNLDTISGGADGLIVRVRAENAARTVVLKDGTGNLELAGADITLDDMNQYVELQYDGVLSKWLVVGGAGVDLSGVLQADGSVDVINQVFKTATELTISGGTITRTQAIHTIDTEGDVPSDELDTIHGGAGGAGVGYLVSGAGDPLINGPYLLGGTEAGKNYYVYGSYYIWWHNPSVTWFLSTTLGTPGGEWQYINSGASEPPLSGWTVGGGGTPPAGTLSSSLPAEDGTIVRIRAENDARTVVLKDGIGNLELGGADITLDDTNRYIALQYDEALSKWLVVGDGGGGVPIGVLFADGSVDIINQVFNAATELTIAGGVITRTQAIHTIDTESDDPTDNLDTISGGADGLIVRVRAENAARTVVLKDGTGNLELAGADITLDDTDRYVELQYDGVLSKWLLVGEPAEAQTPEPVVFEVGHGEILDGITNDEFHRFQLQAGETFTLTRLELQLKGGGTDGDVSVNVYDSTGASQMDSVTAGSVSVSGGVSTAVALILVRVTNSSGGDVNGTIIVRGYITPAPEYVALEMGHGEIADGLSNEEFHRFQLQAGETFTLTRLELQLKGGGTNANVSVNVYDSTGASQIDSVTAGAVSVVGGASGVASLVLIRVTNSSGGDVNGTIIVHGKIES